MEHFKLIERSMGEFVNIQLDSVRRKALYPDLQAMEKRTAVIRKRRAAVPLAEADQDVEHLLHHIDMLNKTVAELRKEKGR